MAPATAPIAAGSMLASYAIASRVGSSSGAIVTMASAMGWCARRWQNDHGTVLATALSGVYITCFGLSHPLARRIGAWPAVLGVAAFTGAVSHVAADRH